jgi:hypothetical protein
MKVITPKGVGELHSFLGVEVGVVRAVCIVKDKFETFNIDEIKRDLPKIEKLNPITSKVRDISHLMDEVSENIGAKKKVRKKLARR